MAKIITNTAPIIKLCQVDALGLLQKLYEEIWTTDYIHEEEFLYPEKLVNFKNANIFKKTPDKSQLEIALKKFDKIDYGEITCAALYAEGDYTELLMANKDAETAFIQNGINVRNILELAYISVKKAVYMEENARKFVKDISKLYKPTDRVIKRFKAEGFGHLIE